MAPYSFEEYIKAERLKLELEKEKCDKLWEEAIRKNISYARSAMEKIAMEEMHDEK